MPLGGITIPSPFTKYNTPESAILFPVGERHVGWETREGMYQRVNTHKAIIRMNQKGDGVHVLSVVGNNYKLVHNRELFGRVEETLCKMLNDHDLADVQVNDRASGFGRICYRDYVFPNIMCIVNAHSRSTVAFRLIVQNGYGGSALRVHAGAIDFYCSNGMVNGEHTNAYRKHTSGLMIEGISHAVEQALEMFNDSKSKWQRWSEKPVTHGEAMQLFRDIAQTAKLQENLSDQYLKERDERGHNLWAVYSALTYYASHSDGQFSLRSTVEQQDTVASTMLQRELNVAQWVKSDAWKKLEDA